MIIELEVDRDVIGEMSFSLKETQSEKERFSSSMFNLKHFFGNKNTLANLFEMKLMNVFICEPFKYKANQLNEKSKQSFCFLGLEVENLLSGNVNVDVVDSDILVELCPELVDGNFVKIKSNLLNLLHYTIFNKNKANFY